MSSLCNLLTISLSFALKLSWEILGTFSLWNWVKCVQLTGLVWMIPHRQNVYPLCWLLWNLCPMASTLPKKKKKNLVIEGLDWLLNLPFVSDFSFCVWISVFYLLFLFLALKFWFYVQLLDWLLGKGHFALMRRAELKTLVDMHGNEVGSMYVYHSHYGKPGYPGRIFGI